MEIKLAQRVLSLSPSSTLAITAKAKEMQNQGQDIIGLGAGEPDFNTPLHILEAAKESMDKGLTKYTASAGLPELKRAIIEKFSSDQALEYGMDQIIVGNGAKHALYTLFQVIIEQGDEVIVPSPYWVSYPEFVKLAGGKPIIVECTEENEYKMTPEQLSASITSRTKAIIINSPSNPTGMVYSRSELEALGRICLENNILVVSDEIYEKLVYGGQKHISIAQISDELKEQTIIVNGVSKSHSMTGWRIGYAAGNKEIIEAMTNLASHSTSNPTTTSQYAAVAAYTGTEEPVEEMRKSFEQRLETVYPKLVSIPGFTCLKPQGAFYLFPNVMEAVKAAGYKDADAFAEALLLEGKVAVIPGSGFGAPDNIRLSYATSLGQLEEGVERIRLFVESKMK